MGFVQLLHLFNQLIFWCCLRKGHQQVKQLLLNSFLLDTKYRILLTQCRQFNSLQMLQLFHQQSRWSRRKLRGLPNRSYPTRLLTTQLLFLSHMAQKAIPTDLLRLNQSRASKDIISNLGRTCPKQALSNKSPHRKLTILKDILQTLPSFHIPRWIRFPNHPRNCDWFLRYPNLPKFHHYRYRFLLRRLFHHQSSRM
jgi:hypothetical protein